MSKNTNSINNIKNTNLVSVKKTKVIFIVKSLKTNNFKIKEKIINSNDVDTFLKSCI